MKKALGICMLFHLSTGTVISQVGHSCLTADVVKAISSICESNSEPFTFINLSSRETILNELIAIYPQPANSTIWIKVSGEWQSSVLL